MIITTQRLILMSPDETNSNALCEYLTRNKEFLARYNPQREDDFYTASYQEEILEQQRIAWKEKTSCRFYIFMKNNPSKLIGFVALNTILMGSFRSCFLGYQLDVDSINQGYTTEAVERVIQYAFQDLGLHRIEANIMPSNEPSKRVAEKLGFTYEGTSKKLLKIKGVWEDHLRFVLLNDAME